jgi:hypothetical protein
VHHCVNMRSHSKMAAQWLRITAHPLRNGCAPLHKYAQPLSNGCAMVA